MSLTFLIETYTALTFFNSKVTTLWENSRIWKHSDDDWITQHKVS